MSKARLLFLALPPPQVVEAIRSAMARDRLEQRLGRCLFAPSNWHQSLSERIYSPTAQECDAMLPVGAAIAASAHACTLEFNRINSQVDPEGRIHWTLQGHGLPKPFEALRTHVRRQIEIAGETRMLHNPSPHITLSYGAAEPLQQTIQVDPWVRWTIDELLLVIGGGKPYAYEIVGRWPLLPEIDPPATQMDLF